MNELVIAYDFGTGGIKASLHKADGTQIASAFDPYDTYYPEAGMHEQRPEDWWRSFITSTRMLFKKSGADRNAVAALSISGHSLGVVPIDKNGTLLCDRVPIWSDMRAEKEAGDFFNKNDYTDWYEETGNGFPPHLYSAFKIQWYRNNRPDIYENASVFLGTKDYINYLLTGTVCTDHSYASGSGVYDLKAWGYDEGLIKAMEIKRSAFPDITASTDIIGTVSESASEQTGLPTHVKVICGGVDNSCMALGTGGNKEGSIYTSLGSSSWIAVTSHEPVIEKNLKPYVFAHVIPDMYTSATSIFAGGSSFRWARNQLCLDLLSDESTDTYVKMGELAESSPVGANKLFFNPSLAGGSGSDRTPNVRGAFTGLELIHTRSDMLRSVMEGIALSLRIALDRIRELTDISDNMLLVGGGGNSPFWRQMFADIYGLNIIKTTVGQDAGSLGAAALASVGVGFWKDFSNIDALHELVMINRPEPEKQEKYEMILKAYKEVNERLYEIGDIMAGLNI